MPFITQNGYASPSLVPPDPRLLIEYCGAAAEMLGLQNVDVTCATLVVGMVPKVVAHMHPGASPRVLVHPKMALGFPSVTVVEIRDRDI